MKILLATLILSLSIPSFARLTISGEDMLPANPAKVQMGVNMNRVFLQYTSLGAKFDIEYSQELLKEIGYDAASFVSLVTGAINNDSLEVKLVNKKLDSAYPGLKATELVILVNKN